jgi:glycosyltransferase involved in cell wall biosynthesis
MNSVADLTFLASTAPGVGAPRRQPLRLAVLCDYPEEAWPSMNLCAEMLVQHLADGATGPAQATRSCPDFRRRVSRLPLVGSRRWAVNADRLLNRLWDYPRHARRLGASFDVFHLCDHSYSQLVHALPADRVGVFCHDLDTFRCLLDPAAEPRPRWFRAMVRRILQGLQKAAVVFHTTAQVRRQIEQHGLIDAARLVQVPLGVAPEFRPAPAMTAASSSREDEAPFMLHVGSCIPRKRMDVLLEVFARARSHVSHLRLVKVGGPWTPAQQAQIDRLGLGAAVVCVGGLHRRELAALYRQAALVLLPSEAEGFGLPVIEALACGSIVVASDIAAFREVGGAALVYCPVAEVPAWSDKVCELLANPSLAPPLAHRLARARCYSWEAHARKIVEAYRGLVVGGRMKGLA